MIPRRARALSVMLAAAWLAASCDTPVSQDPTLTLLSGASATDTVLAILSEPLLVEVIGRDGPAAGRSVRFEAPSDNVASFSEGPAGPWSATLVAQADVRGRARAHVRLGRQAGDIEITVSAPGLVSATPVSYTVLPGALLWLDVYPADTAVVAGGSYTLRPRFLDRWQNPREDEVVFESLTPGVTVDPEGNVSSPDFARASIAVTSGIRSDTAHVSWVPDGVLSGVRILEDARQLILFTTEGTFIQHVATLPVHDPPVHPHWSPDGEKLVGAADSLFLIGLDGEIEWLDSPGMPEVAQNPRFASDSDWIFFNGLDSDEPSGIARVRSDGTDFERLSSPGDPEEGWDHSPSPSSDERVAFSRTFVGLMAMDLESRVSELVTNLATRPEWAPTADLIAYFANHRLHVIAPDGTGARMITQEDLGFLWSDGISWSPDSEWLVAVRNGIVLIHIEIGLTLPIPHPLPPLTGIPIRHPSWRP